MSMDKGTGETSSWHEFFDVDRGYLDTATVGVPPRSSVAAMSAMLSDWRQGRLHIADFDECVRRSREAWARLSSVDPSWVTIGSTVSGLVGYVAAALPAGARVLVADGEFTSVLFPFLVQQQARGIDVVEVPLESIDESIDDSFDLVAVSAVQSATGQVVDVNRLSGAARAHGVQVLVDTTQSCGWLPVDVSMVDYAVCSAYKWLLCPRGVAFMSVRPERLETLVPHAAGWYAGNDVWKSIYGSPLRLADNSRRLDVSPAWFSWVGAADALEFLVSVSPESILDHNVQLANALLDRLGLPPRNSAIVTLTSRRGAYELEESGVRVSVRDGRLRAAFHIYNDADDVDAAAAALVG